MNQAFENNPELKVQYPLASKAAENKAQSLITFVTDRAGHDRRYAIDATKTQKKIGL